MTSLGMRRCRPLISPLVAGTKPVHPLDAGPGVHDEDMASRARAPRGWPPGAGRIGARPRNCGSWWAATRLQRPATRLDVSCRVAAQVSDTRPKLLYETQDLSSEITRNFFPQKAPQPEKNTRDFICEDSWRIAR